MAKARRDTRQPRSDAWIWVGVAVVVTGFSLLMGLVVIPALTAEDVTPAQAEALYTRRCQTCHGQHGQGNFGPAIGNGAVADAFPDIDDQIQVMTDGRDQMPAFGTVLTDAEIRAIAEYTRSELGRDQPAASS